MKHTRATKKKLSAMRTGDKNPFFGRKHTDEFKRRQSERAFSLNAKRRYDIGPRTMLVPESAVTWAYVAGLIDGEGNIRFAKDQPVISIANTYKPVMAWLVKTLGGSVRYQSTARSRIPCGIWSIYGARNCATVLDRTNDFLIIKRDIAAAMKARLIEKYGERLNG